MRISVRVKPGSKLNSVELEGEHYLVRLRAQPVEGKANTALICVLADHFGVKKRDVEIRSGVSARYKIVEIRKDP